MHLIDAFMPVIARVVQLRVSSAADQPEYEVVRHEIGRLLAYSETISREAGIDLREYDEAKFVVCAWIDEVVLASAWRGKALWQHEQLQRLHYQTTDAGVEVFERLDALQPHQHDVREVYSHCLALGFRGRYIGEGDALLLEQLKKTHLARLLGEDAAVRDFGRSELFPGAADIGTDAAPRPKGTAVTPLQAVALTAPIILFVFLYLVYRFVLNGLAVPLG